MPLSALAGQAQRLAPIPTRTLDFSLDELTFTEGMSKRTGPGPFAGAPIVQGDWDGTGTPDVVTAVRGAQVATSFYANLDPYQGSIVLWLTPEWAGGDAQQHRILTLSANCTLEKTAANTLVFTIAAGASLGLNVAAWTAGTLYCVICSWDSRNTIDGTNYLRVTANDAHSYGQLTTWAAEAPSATMNIGQTVTPTFAADAIIEGLTIYRVPLYDGTYGADLWGGRDVMNEIWAAGVGADPCEITGGSWHIPLCLPTNSTLGALVTGTGEAWSHPHGSEAVTDAFAETAYGASAWADEGTPLALDALEYNATTTTCVIPDAAAIQDLHDAAFTVEAWIRADGWGENNEGRIFDKTASAADGWAFWADSTYGLVATVYTDTQDGVSRCGTDEFRDDGRLHHVAMQYDDGGDQLIYLWVDGIPVSSYVLQQVATGNVDSDIGNDLIHGNRSDSARTFDGALGGWCRLSNILRYTAGKAFVPNGPETAPALPDANSVWQTDYSDAAGAVLTDDSATGSNGALANHTWDAYRDLDDGSAGDRLYQWGYMTGSDAALEGITQTLAGLTPGENYVVQAVVKPTPDGNAYPLIRIRDETNGAQIVDFYGPRYTGVHTGAMNLATLIDAGARWQQAMIGASLYNVTDGSSTTITAVSGDGTTITGVLAGGTDNDWDTNDVYRITWAHTGMVGNAVHKSPWIESFTFELPTIARNGSVADCVSISVKVLNANTVGTLYVDQIELLENLLDNPSMETGAAANPWIPDGWVNLTLDPGDSQTSSTGGAAIHSGVEAMQLNVGAANEGFIQTLTPGVDAFIGMGTWFYGDGAASMDFGASSGAQASIHSALTTRFGPRLATTAAWTQSGGVWRMNIASYNCYCFLAAGAGAARYIDDIFGIALSPVSLTVTPANAANSAESGGIRVDGLDTATQPVNNRIRARSGHIRWRQRPRHAPANGIAFEESAAYVFRAQGAANYIEVEYSAANQVTMSYNDGGVQTVNWACAGEWIADEAQFWEVIYAPTFMRLIVGGVIEAQITAALDFAADVPTVMHWGGDNTNVNQGDAVFRRP